MLCTNLSDYWTSICMLFHHHFFFIISILYHSVWPLLIVNSVAMKLCCFFLLCSFSPSLLYSLCYTLLSTVMLLSSTFLILSLAFFSTLALLSPVSFVILFLILYLEYLKEFVHDISGQHWCIIHTLTVFYNHLE